MASVKFKLRKWTIFVTMYIGYVFFAYNRKTFTFAMPTIMKEEGLDKDDLGLITSSQTLAYTISKFLAGILVDKFSPKLLFAAGLSLLGICTLLFTFYSSVWVLSAIWFMVGFSAGSGWPSCAKILRQWFTPVEFGTWWSVLSTSMNLAGSIGPPLATFLIMTYSWQASFYIPALLSIFMAIISLVTLCDSPEDIGVRTAQKENKINDNNESPAGGLWRNIVKSPFLWLISVSYLVVYMVRTAALDWAQLYLIQDKNQSQYISSIFISSLEIGGIIGSIIAGYLADMSVAWSKRNPGQLKGSPRLLVVIALVAGMALFLHLLLFTISQMSSQGWITFIGFGLGFTIYGPVAVYGVMAIESAPSHIAGTCYAVVALSANVGAVMAGLPLTLLARSYDWSMAFLLLEGLSVLILILKVLGRNLEPRIAVNIKKLQ